MPASCWDRSVASCEALSSGTACAGASGCDMVCVALDTKLLLSAEVDAAL